MNSVYLIGSVLSRLASQAWASLWDEATHVTSRQHKNKDELLEKNANIKSLCEVESVSGVVNKLKATSEDEVMAPARVLDKHRLCGKG